MPKDLQARRARCLEWMGRPSPTASPCASDDEEEGEDAMIEGDATIVESLLGLTSTCPVLEEGEFGEGEMILGEESV